VRALAATDGHVKFKAADGRTRKNKGEIKMTQPLSLDTILSELNDESEAWVLQDKKTKKYLTIPDLRYPGRNPIRFFLKKEDAQAILTEVLDVNQNLTASDIVAKKVKLIPSLKSIANDKTSGNADSFVVHTPNEVFDWIRERY
jgi:hypothetical protein